MIMHRNTVTGLIWLGVLLVALFGLGACSGGGTVVTPPAGSGDSGSGPACLRIFWTNDQSLMARLIADLGEGKGFVPLVHKAVEQNPGAAADSLVCSKDSELQPALAGLAKTLEPGQVVGPVDLNNGQALVMATSRRHFHKARELAKARQWEDAKQELMEELELNPDNVSAWWLLSLARLETGDKQGALEAADKGLTWRPQNAPLLNARGAALAGLGKKDQAIESYRLALEYQPDDPLAMNNLAWALSERGAEPDTALALASEAVRLKPERPEFWDTLGLTHQKQGQYHQAASAYFHALKLDPKNPKLERKLLDCLLELEPQKVEGLWVGQGVPKLVFKAPGKANAPQKAKPKSKPAPKIAESGLVQKTPIPGSELEGKTLAYPGASAKKTAKPNTDSGAQTAVTAKPVVKTAPAKPETKPAVKTRTAKRAGRHYVQVASFRAESLAKKSLANWRRLGYQCRYTPMDLGRRGKWYRVLLGPYPSRNKASHVALDLRRKRLIKSYRLVGLP